ncbi:MAG: segregation/condensation protein A [Syntrophotaleaceae bacterium]
MTYEIELESFKGPLDLLLHLIKKNEMDIYDIPIAEITSQYLAAVDAMQSLNLEVAGEFLVMAATLLHIKSRMLLPKNPVEEPEEEEVDPRTELVQRLLEYQKYRDAAESLDRLPLLERDVFVRKGEELPEAAGEEETENLGAIGLFELMEAFQQLLREKGEPACHEVEMESVSLADRIQVILDSLARRRQLSFRELLTGTFGRGEIVVTFLAMLELVKLRMLRLMQNNRCGTIWLYAAGAGDSEDVVLKDEALGYK